MKKTKPVSLHNIQTTSLSLTKKKSPSSVKIKVTKPSVSKKSIQTFKTSSQPEDYIIINDNIYSANTFTQRNSYDQFLTKIKKDKQQTRKSFLTKQTLQQSQVAKLKRGKQSTKKKFRKLTPEDLIKCMTLDEKREMFLKLQSEITSQPQPNLPINLPSLSENNKQSQPCSTQSFQHDISSRLRQDSQRQRLQKFHLLSQKLQRIKKELIQKWQTQLEKLQDLFTAGRIGQKQKQNKKIIIEKLKDHKLKIIECTRTLFQKILQQQDDTMMTNNNVHELEQKKNDKIEAILQSLHSLPSLQSLKDEQIERQPNIDHLKVNNQKQKRQQNGGMLAFSSETSIQQLSQREKKTQQVEQNKNQADDDERNFNKKTIFAPTVDIINITNKRKIATTKIDQRQLNTVENNGDNEFFNDFTEDIVNKKTKLRQQLISPLNFMNNNLKNGGDGFGYIEQIKSVVNNNSVPDGVPSKSEQMLKQLLDLGDITSDKQKKLSPLGQQNNVQSTTTKLSLKLDLRLDDIVFGQDEYSHLDKDSHSHLQQQNNAQQQFQHEISFDAKLIDELMMVTNNNNYNNNNDSYNNNQSTPKIQQVRLISKSDNKKKTKKRSLLQFNEEDEEEKAISSSDRGSKSNRSVNSLTKISLKKLQGNNVIVEKSKDEGENQPIISAQRNIVEQQTQSQRDTISPKFQLSLSIKEKPPIIPQQPHLPIPLPQPSPHIQPQQPQHNQHDDNSLDQLQCHQPPHTTKPTIDIPLLLSKQKMQTLIIQHNRMFKENIDKRIAFQMGCYQPQSAQSTTTITPHFTTLVDINSYIVGLYEFMMRKYMSSLVDSLNIPYGKSAIDKLYSLHTEGFVLQESYNQMNNILSEAHFKEYQREMTLTVRKCSQYEIAHNKAVFEAFTKAINVYRPYYELEGEVFPWIVSQKGITFYEITQDNIEEVFEKSKIKVLQYCTSLCGIHPPAQVKNDQQQALVNNKNQENLNKLIKTQTLQLFDQWKIRFVNFDCLVRMLIGKLVVAQLINEATEEFKALAGNNKQIQ